MAITFSTTVQLELIECATCGVHFGITPHLQKNRRADKEGFCCPNGHINVYRQSEADRLRLELKRKEQELADKAIEKIRVQAELDKANRQLKRVSRGVCPCCNRTFKNLSSHMKTKHADLINKK